MITRTSHRTGGVIKTLLKIFVVLVLLLAVAAGYLYWRIQSNPAFWDQNNAYLAALSPQELENIADSVQNRVLSQATSIKASPASTTGSTGSTAADRAVLDATRAGGAYNAEPGNSMAANRSSATAKTNGSTQSDEIVIDQTPRQITITIDEANAWLATRIQDLAGAQGLAFPDGVSSPMIAIENGQLVSAFRVKRGPVDRPISMVFDLDVSPGGMATVKLKSVRAGQQPLPAKQLAELLTGTEGDSSELSRHIGELFQGKSFDPIFQIDAKRNLRVLGVDLSAGDVKLNVRTEPQ